MIGRNLDEMFKKDIHVPREPIREVRNLSIRALLHSVSSRLGKGETLRIAGFVGAARTKPGRSWENDSGSVLIEGKIVQIKSPAVAIKAGISLVPCKELAFALGLSLRKNIAILAHLARIGLICTAQETNVAQTYVERLSIKTPPRHGVIQCQEL